MLQNIGTNAPAGLLWPADDFARDRALCLDFVNTVSWRGKENPTDYLEASSQWMSWMRENKLAEASELAELERRASMWAGEAESAHRRAMEFRESLYNLLFAYSRKEKANGGDVAAVQELLDEALERLSLVEEDGKWQWKLSKTGVDWQAPLYACALSAAQLLTGPWASRLRACGRDECLWLFLDLTKNRSRKWCSMEPCGNVVKARRSYARKKQKG